MYKNKVPYQIFLPPPPPYLSNTPPHLSHFVNYDYRPVSKGVPGLAPPWNSGIPEILGRDVAVSLHPL